MANPLRSEVLKAFKNLHRARLTVFRGDERILNDSREKINKEFKKNKAITDASSLHDMISYANAVAHELITTVVQAEEKTSGVFELHIRPETTKLDNMPFDPNVEIPKRRRGKGQQPPCCEENISCCQEVK
ncbi:complex III assembly factor LYRM7 [Halyomorpha halys]|uniref:complex III assembly factor LYRM7 n=1 Tax=Halyomorpha halys TaxID=286706 RepID=UPI0006D512CF|nr:complex III assembly factor LYRM7 [Halyomorpha halys]